jgi:hypothetical protein
LCAVACGAYAGLVIHGAGARPVGPLTGLGAGLVTVCAVATALTAMVDAKRARASTTASLHRLGAPALLLRRAAALRAGVVVAALAPVTCLIAELAVISLGG